MKRLYITAILMLYPSLSISSAQQDSNNQKQPTTTTEVTSIPAVAAQAIRINQVAPITSIPVVTAQTAQDNQLPITTAQAVQPRPLPAQRQPQRHRLNQLTAPTLTSTSCCIIPYYRKNTTPEVVISGRTTATINRNETECGWCCCHFNYFDNQSTTIFS